MRTLRVSLLLLLLCSSQVFSQGSGVTWTDITDSTLPRGVRLYRGERASPLLRAWYFKVDLNDSTIAIRSYLLSTPLSIVPFIQSTGALAAVNGGFFGGTSSVSAVVYPGEVKAQNIAVINRSGVNYPVTRSFFGIDTRRQMGVRWIYHFGGTVRDIFTFAQPTPNAPGSPAPTPDSANGARYANLLTGIGGGPTLVKNGQVNITWDQEVFFGSGIDPANPRTAVGYTANRQGIMLVADGRSTLSVGVTIPDLAQIMVDVGCVEAMNLDGGGSTQMAVGSRIINQPSETRAVPTILAIVRADSLRVPPQATFERVIDTGDPPCTLLGTGWFASANPGYWGSTPSQLHAIGPWDASAVFKLGLPRPARYEVYGWWVTSSNRANDAPFIIKHASGRDTVRVNQTLNGSQWKLIGTYSFNGDTTESVTISDAGTTNNYVVADAIRLVSYDPGFNSVREVSAGIPTSAALMQNYPNPFNPETVIGFQIAEQGPVRLSVFDLLGREVTTLVNETLRPGTYQATFRGEGFASGVYFYRLSVPTDGRGPAERQILIRKFILAR